MKSSRQEESKAEWKAGGRQSDEAENEKKRGTWVAQWVKLQTWLRSWSHSSWVWALHWALCWQLRDWSLLQILCLPLSLPHSQSRCVSFSKNKQTLKKFKKREGEREAGLIRIGTVFTQSRACVHLKWGMSSPKAWLKITPMRDSDSQTVRSWSELKSDSDT